MPVPAAVLVELSPKKLVVRTSVTMETTPGVTLLAISAIEPSVKLTVFPSLSP